VTEYTAKDLAAAEAADSIRKDQEQTDASSVAEAVHKHKDPRT